jgi:hypothetical protein
MKIFFILILFLANFVFGESIKLYNDSPFQLTAIVEAANGNVLTQKVMAPNEQSVWDTSQISTQLKINYQSSTSYTPFTVIWQCDYQGYYSVCTNVSPGSIVAATTCPGPHYCQPKPKQANDDKQTSCNNCKPIFND